MIDVWPTEGIVYTETVVHTPPERYVADAPYQLAVIDVAGAGRLTVRVVMRLQAEKAEIGETVRFLEELDGVGFYARVPAN